MPQTLRLILGDQLNHQHSWFTETDDSVMYVCMEMKQETDYVKHHIQKVVSFFLAMRAFAEEKRSKGHHFEYWELNHIKNTQDLTQNLLLLIEEHGIERFEYQEPDEYRLDQQLSQFAENLHIPAQMVSSEHFLVDRLYIRRLFEGKKMYLMETFYRKMRKEHNLLLDDAGKPEGGKWNYDAKNRKKYKGEVPVPTIKTFTKDIDSILTLLKEANVETIGTIDSTQLVWPTSREEALDVLEDFVKQHLPYFGDFQDAMHTKHPYLFHSRLSFALNTNLLHPIEVVKASIEAWEKHQERISLSQVEGFIRQIIGWREYMRGIYWDKMPEFATMNFFEHNRKLPAFYWTGNTKMTCLKDAISGSLENAYAHHIQRLMVTGSFALLAGIHPDEVDEWYLGIYIDAIEWVEITNTRGMSQFADGGIVGTKPYVGSANYMHKMSNYCTNCHYDKKQKYGDKACPFNSLYWHFYSRNREQLERNPRIGMMYRTLDKMNDEEKQKILTQADQYLEHLDHL